MVIAPLRQHWITALGALVAGLGAFAAGVGVLTAWGHVHYSFTTLRGEVVSMQGGGLYAHDSVSGAAQAIGQDFVTLLVAVLLLSARLGLPRGHPAHSRERPPERARWGSGFHLPCPSRVGLVEIS